jgi:hypothetical protein
MPGKVKKNKAATQTNRARGGVLLGKIKWGVNENINWYSLVVVTRKS